MTDKLNYMPHKVEYNGIIYELISIDFTIDFGGRCAECIFQYKDTNGKYKTKEMGYYYLSNKWNNENWLVDDPLTKSIFNIFKIFDTGKRPEDYYDVY